MQCQQSVYSQKCKESGESLESGEWRVESGESVILKRQRHIRESLILNRRCFLQGSDSDSDPCKWRVNSLEGGL